MAINAHIFACYKFKNQLRELLNVTKFEISKKE